MSLAALIDADLETYVAENRGNDRCWFFVHIPKTAGSSFRRELAQILRPNYNVHVDRNPVSGPPVPHPQKIAAATKEFNALLAEQTYRFASGHVPVTLLKAQVDTWRDLKLITMLRDPAIRTVSDYRYQSTPVHPSYQEFLQRFPSFEAYLNAPQSRNRMFNFLRPSREASVEDCIEFVVEHFAFIGLVEMYPLAVRLVTRLMDQERSPTHYIRKTEDNEHNQLDITPELLDRVCELNSLDVALYDYFRAKLSRIDAQVLETSATSHNCSAQLS